MLLFLAIACLPPLQPSDVPDPVELQPASITELTMECDLERERWRLEVHTEWWSGGGELLLTHEGDYVEQHGVRAYRSAADGTTDHLRLDLSIVGDWRQAEPDSSTAMHCSDRPNGLFILFDVDGETGLDCRFWGPHSDLWERHPELPSCAPYMDDSAE